MGTIIARRVTTAAGRGTAGRVQWACLQAIITVHLAARARSTRTVGATRVATNGGSAVDVDPRRAATTAPPQPRLAQQVPTMENPAATGATTIVVALAVVAVPRVVVARTMAQPRLPPPHRWHRNVQTDPAEIVWGRRGITSLETAEEDI